MSSGDTYYDILQINVDDSKEQIKKAYKNRARQLHPDKHPNEPQKYTKLFQHLNNAYHTLIDDKERKKYNAQYVCIYLFDKFSQKNGFWDEEIYFFIFYTIWIILFFHFFFFFIFLQTY